MIAKTAERKTGINEMLESVAFGITDGVICLFGIIVGVARATSDPTAVIIAGVVGGIANAIGNSVGFFISQSTERAVQLHQTDGEDNGLVHSEREVWMSGISAFFATILALIVLILPFFFLSIWQATAISFFTSMVLAFVLGGYVGRLESGRPLKSAVKYALFTVFGAAVSYGVGELLAIWLH